MIQLGHCDIGICEHCTHRCVSCSHLSPLMSKWNMPLDMLERDMMALKPFVEFHTVQLVGGEPTLHPEIVEALRIAKRVRLGRTVSVITNGFLLDRMKEEFWQELEYLQISIYPGKECHVELAVEKSRQYGFGVGERKFDEFYKQFKPVPDDGAESFRLCHWRKDCFTIHRGHFHLCPQSTFFPKTLLALPESIDGLPLEGVTEEKLTAFMERTTPFEACRICCANEIQSAPWAEAKRDVWMKESTKV